MIRVASPCLCCLNLMQVLTLLIILFTLELREHCYAASSLIRLIRLGPDGNQFVDECEWWLLYAYKCEVMLNFRLTAFFLLYICYVWVKLFIGPVLAFFTVMLMTHNCKWHQLNNVEEGLKDIRHRMLSNFLLLNSDKTQVLVRSHGARSKLYDYRVTPFSYIMCSSKGLVLLLTLVSHLNLM